MRADALLFSNAAVRAHERKIDRHTMKGTEQSPGVLALAVRQIFDHIDADKDRFERRQTQNAPLHAADRFFPPRPPHLASISCVSRTSRSTTR